ncbi:HdeD family acid-resistance protein [Bifidobacterium pullorum]|uniref:HdeD family acid-resistance protein n=1 Tax=Bifidobacterium pullorum TaxID=78448 RepID=UPI00320ACADB
MSDQNVNGLDSNGQQPGSQPEYGAYAPNAGNPNAAGDGYGDNNQYYAQYTQYTYTQGGAPNDGGYQGYSGGPYGQPGPGHLGDPFKLFEQMLPQQAKNAVRALYGVIGVAAVVLGLALLLWPSHTLVIAAVLLGIYFVVSGVIRIVSSIVELGLPAGWRVLNVFVGILLSIGGVVVLKNAALSGTTMLVMITLVVGIGWIIEGVTALLESWKLPQSGWSVLYAIVSVLAGLIVLFAPLSSAMWLMVFGGIALIVMGVASVVRAFSFGRTPKAR